MHGELHETRKTLICQGLPLQGSNVAAGEAANSQLVTAAFSQPTQANMREKNLQGHEHAQLS